MLLLLTAILTVGLWAVPVRGQEDVASDADGFVDGIDAATTTEDLPHVMSSDPTDGEEEDEEEDADEDGVDDGDEEVEEDEEEGEEDGDDNDNDDSTDADGEEEASGDAAGPAGSEEEDPEPRNDEFVPPTPAETQDCNCEEAVRNAVTPLEQAVEQARHDRDEMQVELASVRILHERLVEAHTAMTQAKDASHQELGQVRDSLRRAEDHIRELMHLSAARIDVGGGSDLDHPGISLVRHIGKVVKKAIADVQAFVDAKMKQLTKQE